MFVKVLLLPPATGTKLSKIPQNGIVCVASSKTSIKHDIWYTKLK